jgi:hypothetical protein
MSRKARLDQWLPRQLSVIVGSGQQQGAAKQLGALLHG